MRRRIKFILLFCFACGTLLLSACGRGETIVLTGEEKGFVFKVASETDAEQAETDTFTEADDVTEGE